MDLLVGSLGGLFVEQLLLIWGVFVFFLVFFTCEDDKNVNVLHLC